MTKIFVKVKPEAKSDAIVGWLGEVLKVQIKAKPIDGEANRRLVSFLAEKLDLSKSAVKIVAGANSRQKLLEIDVEKAYLQEKLS